LHKTLYGEQRLGWFQDEFYSKTIVMKLDVEGAERDLVPRLIMSGALCHLDIVFMEDGPCTRARLSGSSK
jgi:hypothetical protein